VPRSVAIVLEKDFGGELEKLAFRTPVWLIDTPENRFAAERAWHAAVEWPHITVNLFRPTEDFAEILRLIELQEPFDAVEVMDSAQSDAVRTALAARFGRVDATASGFRARRKP
jgi:hypothetical protein